MNGWLGLVGVGWGWLGLVGVGWDDFGHDTENLSYPSKNWTSIPQPPAVCPTRNHEVNLFRDRDQ